MYLIYLNKDSVVTGYIEVYNTEITDGKISGTDSYVLVKDSLPENWNNTYYKDDIFKQLPTRKNSYYTWNLSLEQWQEPEGYLQTIQTENTTQVNQLASQKIIQKYPIYLQLNLPYDFGQDSVEVETMRTWIDSVRTLANTAKAGIALATTLPEITTIVDNFKQELAEIS